MSINKEVKKVTDKNGDSQEQNRQSHSSDANILQDLQGYLTNDTVTSEKERIAKGEKTTASDRKGTLPSRAELEQRLRTRAHKDETFRQEFLTNPRKVLERDYADYFPGGKVPDGKIIKVTEEDEQTFHLVLPPKPSDILSDISAEVLESVQGGVGMGEMGLGRLGLSPMRDGLMSSRLGRANDDTGQAGCSEPCHSGNRSCN
jgi:hypothetical protein